MSDYTYPSVYFAYLYFFILFGVALFIFARTFRDGYWGRHSEDAKFRMLDED